MKRNAITLILMIMVTIALTLTIFPSQVRAVDVKITSITPSTHRGNVGDSIHISGTINKTDALYRIWFGNQSIISTNATGNNVSAIFSVPRFPRGNYTIILQDVDMNINATEWFYIDTAYYVEAKKPTSPIQLQEGSTVEIWANITGGKPNTIYHANITVKLPSPRNETYKKIVTFTNTTTTGEGYNLTTIYPNNFNGAPNTKYVGAYTVYFNMTLDIDTFSIGLTNSTDYHRDQTVGIKAIGYNSNENVTIKINSGNKTIDSILSVNATGEGTIYANWPVPSNASVGTYLVNITSISLPPTTKIPSDVQSFVVPGFDVNITTRNLATEPVSNVTVQVFEKAKSVANVNSTSSGLAQTNLEIGNYTCKAFYKGEKVGELLINITGAARFDLNCSLTSLKILVKALVDGVEVGVPEVKLHLSLVNQTRVTDVNGTAVVPSLLPNRTYILNASRYNMSPFNTTTIPQLPAQAWYNIPIYIPTVTLKINVADGQNRLIEDELKITAKEFMGGLYYSNNTINGVAIIRCAIGKYNTEAYGKIDSTYVKLNETTVDLFQEKQMPLICKLYGLNVSVRVVDYFGQLIPNVDVVMKREALQYVPSTKSSGLVTFNNIIGGELQIEVFLSGQANASLASTYYVDSSKVIEVKLSKYVVLAGFLVETSILALMIIIVATVLLVLLIEVYRKKRIKPQQSQS